MMQLRFLVVDDEERFRANMVKLLTAKGMLAEGAAGADEALAALRRTRPDVVLLDVRMPGTDGVAALPGIRALAPEADVIVLTGHASVDDAVELLARGASEYMVKPCTVDDVLETVTVVRDRRGAGRA